MSTRVAFTFLDTAWAAVVPIVHWFPTPRQVFYAQQRTPILTYTWKQIWAAGAPSAGAAEDSSADTLQQEAAPQTFNKLQAEVNIPVWSFAGANDDTAGVDGSEQTEAEVKKLGGSEYKLTVIEGADHSAMNIKPWTDYDLLSWFLQQSKSGTSSPAQSGAASGAISVGASSAPAATETGSSGDDLEDDDDDWEDEDEEDCEEEDDDDDDDYDEEEECDEEDESTGSDQSGAQPNASGSAAIPASSGTVADGSGSSSEDEEDCDDSRYNKLRRRSPVLTAERHIIERQAHHHVFAHSKRNWEVPLDASMQHLAARQALAQDQKHKRSLAKRALTTHAHGHALGRRSGHSSSRMARVVRR